MQKIVNPIIKKTYGGRSYKVFISIKFVNGKLSISGVEGPLKSGNAIGSCGQIDMHLRNEDMKDWKFEKDWTPAMMVELLEVWDRWHLNDMKAGTPKQEEFIREWKKSNKYDYNSVCKALEEAGLYIDNEYRYGSKWLTEEIPEEVIKWLFELPDNKANYAWI